MLGASPEFSQYSEHLEQVVRELTESLVVTTNIVEAYDGEILDDASERK